VEFLDSGDAELGQILLNHRVSVIAVCRVPLLDRWNLDRSHIGSASLELEREESRGRTDIEDREARHIVRELERRKRCAIVIVSGRDETTTEIDGVIPIIFFEAIDPDPRCAFAERLDQTSVRFFEGDQLRVRRLPVLAKDPAPSALGDTGDALLRECKSGTLV
jgi:hypothetical protein